MSALRSGSRILVRFNFESIRLLGEDGEKIWPEQAEGFFPMKATSILWYLPDWPAPLRVIGGRNNEAKRVADHGFISR